MKSGGLFAFLHPSVQRLLKWNLYRYRFLLSYVVIGFASILVELAVIRAVRPMVGTLAGKALGLGVGVLFAFTLNARFNFKVPAPKRRRALLLFTLISALSFLLSTSLRRYLEPLGFGYEQNRLLASGAVFFVAYALHRRFSFREFKQVGVAVYAKGNEAIGEIYRKVENIADFIHVDIVDETFNATAPHPATYKLETVRAYWPDKEIHCHLMTRRPSHWLPQILPYVDTVVIHYEIDDSLEETIQAIRAQKKSVGLCLLLGTGIGVLQEWLARVDEVMLLTIPDPGSSGQAFGMAALERIRAFNAMPGRDQVYLCVDGGVNEKNIGLIQAEKIVSGSYILNGADPMRNIFRLQTSSQYEAI